MAVMQFLKKYIGSRNERSIKRLQKIVLKINNLEEKYAALDNTALKNITPALKKRLATGETLEQLLPDAFATVREAAKRTLGLRHFDVQLIGGIALHEGNIAEMLTGEGKTLVATLPAYLNALTEKSTHIITVNEYLVKRDAEWMRPVFEFLGLTVGINVPGMSIDEKKQAYQADILYGTNNEFGFDYLRDNMVFELNQRVQKHLNFAIVDEVDSVLIDEARTPLIISGQAEDISLIYQKINALIPHLNTENNAEFFTVDEKAKQVHLSEEGHQKVEKLLLEAGLLAAHSSLYDASNVTLLHYLSACLRAHTLYQKDVHYIVKNDEIIIVDEHTGRLMAGRRWSDGLHQAIEAKENVHIQTENQTLASITFQNYFRLYNKLAGMTGTADTEAYEFHQIYNLEVVVIPSNKTIKRQDYPDKIYMTTKAKFEAVIAEIKACQEKEQPVLVGTTSIEVSEYLSGLLKKAAVPHQVLNAKQHEREAHIIAQAGKPGAVTIATNMAGRGTDIVLGGNIAEEIAEKQPATQAEKDSIYQAWEAAHAKVISAGGLHVLGTERHESRRIDNQLRGRSGRQGDPGSSRFYLSLEDNLLRIFAADKLTAFMSRLGLNENEAMESHLLSRIIENAQKKVEGYHFDIRKELLDFDNVTNEQRKVIYAQRNEILMQDDANKMMQHIIADAASLLMRNYVPENSLYEDWDLTGLESVLLDDFAVQLPLSTLLKDESQITETALLDKIIAAITAQYESKKTLVPIEVFVQVEKSILLSTLDLLWKEHLASMEHLRQSIHLRGYAQKNPKQEYKKEAFAMFSLLLDNLRREVISALCLLSAAPETMPETTPPLMSLASQQDHQMFMTTDTKNTAKPEAGAQKLRRNDPCYCGSSKKFKHCHGKAS